MSLTSSSTRRITRTFTPSLLGLEERKLLAGSINFGGGTLSFYGGNGVSQAELSPSTTTPGNIVATIDGVSEEFSAADVKLVMFYSSREGQDSFINNTNKTSISNLRGTGNSVLGGFGSDFVLDYSSDGANFDDQDGGMIYINGTDGRPHTYAVSLNDRGSVVVRVF